MTEHDELIALGDVDESTMPAIFEVLLHEGKVRRFAELKAAWSFVQPILAANPGWKWRDAAKWMQANGKAAEAQAAYRAAGDKVGRIERSFTDAAEASAPALFSELDPMLQGIIAAHPGLRNPNELASLTLAEIDPKGKAPEALAFVVRRTLRDRAADLLGVKREPPVMDADEARLEATVNRAIGDAIADR